jgi:hypothetical protein
MNTNYGGGGVESRHAAKNAALGGDVAFCRQSPPANPLIAQTRPTAESRSSDRPASTLSAREQYARDAMADSAPSPTDVHYREF